MPNNINLRESWLFVLPWTLNSLGGVNQVVENLYREMKKDNKYDPLILVNSWHDIKIRKENIRGIQHHFLRLRSPWDTSRKAYNFMMFCLECFRTPWRISKFLNSNKVTVVNVHYCSLSAINFVILKYLRIFKGRIILSFHGRDLLNARQSRVYESKLWKFLLHRTDKIVTCSNSLKSELLEFDKLCEDKAVAIHNGINLALFSGGFGHHAGYVLEDKKFILNVATFEHKKGQDVLLKAFAEIAETFPEIFLVIIGRPGGAENQIKQLIKALDLSHRVHLYEGLSHDQVLGIMEKSMVFVLPSRYEPFGIVILEAGALSVPVIASNVGGIREIIVHDETGRLCEPDNANALAIEMQNMLREPSRRMRLGENLRRHVYEKFSWETTYTKYIEYNKIHV